VSKIAPARFRDLSETNMLKGAATIAKGIAIASNATAIRTNGNRNMRYQRVNSERSTWDVSFIGSRTDFQT
jgi:hypothetical protein